MYFLDGSDIWKKWIPACFVTFTSCGIARPLQVTDLAPGGGGVGGGCPACAFSRLLQTAYATTARNNWRIVVTVVGISASAGSPRFPDAIALAKLLSSSRRSPVPGLHQPFATASGTPLAVGSGHTPCLDRALPPPQDRAAPAPACHHPSASCLLRTAHRHSPDARPAPAERAA